MTKLQTPFRTVPVLLAIAFAATLAGCTVDRVRTRAANDFECAEEKVEVTDIGASGYRAKGCGQTATFVCNGSVCVREN
jgi:hypothetical protein